MKPRKLLSLLLAIVMVLTILPITPVSVIAAAADNPTEKNITLGASHIEGAQASNVYFGTYKQSSNGNGGYNADPIKWRVLSNADGKLFLLSDQNLDVFEYHKEYEAVTWETSTMRSWLNGLANNKGNGENAIDYTNDNFLDTAFSASEQVAIADTTVVNNDNPRYGTEGGNNTTDKVFLLSIEEAQNTAYGFTDNTNSTDTRKATNTAYVADGGKIGTSGMYDVGAADYWWLRSPGNCTNYAAFVYGSGHVLVDGTDVYFISDAVRPAFNINLSSVLFTSAAKGGKSSTAAAGGGAGIFENVDISTLTDNDGYKLTLLDSSRNAFEATISSISGNTVTVSYSDAKTGDNEYISAIIKNGSTVKYYGRLGLASESGTATVTLPDDFNAANGDVLCIFNEQYNGDYKTDYASELKEMPIYGVAFDANGGTGTMNSVIATGTYTLPANGFTAPDGKEFKGWEIDGTIYSENAKVNVASNITAKAIWVIPVSIQLQSKDLYSSKATGYQLDEKIPRYWKNGDSAEFTGTPDDYNAKIEWSVRDGKDVATITLKGANTVDADNTNYGLTVSAANTFELDIIVEEDSVMDQFTIYACDVNISGKGKLTIVDPKIDAQNIYVDGNLTMSGADIVAESLGKNAANVIFATGDLVIDNSTVEIKSGSDWTQSVYPDYNYAPLRSNGAMTITNDSDVTVTCIEGSTCHAVLAVGDMTIQDSAVTVVNNGTNRGISADNDLYIKGTANVTVNSNGIAIAVRSGKLNISGGTVKATSATTYAAIRADEIEISGGNVTATAADTYGIYAEAGDINISGNANVSATTNTSTAVYAIGNIGISDSANVNASGKWALWSKANNIVVSGGIVEASGTEYAIVSKPVLTSYDNAVIFAGTDKSDATFVNDIAGTNYHGLNYVRIQSGYIVTFDKNGGAGTMANKAVPNGEFTLPVCDFTAQNGYQFKGWATSANGSVISEAAITVSADITLYAIWEKIPADAPTVEAGNDLTLIYKGYTDEQISVSVDEKDGYTYSYQWYDSSKQPISGATYSTYAVPNDLTVGSYDYYCVVTAKRNDNDDTALAESKSTVTVNKATQNAPSGIVDVAETISGKQDGNITGVNSTMEYRRDGESTYNAITGNTVENLAAGKYFVRVKGDDNHNPSAETEVIIEAGGKLAVTVPQNQIGYTLTADKTELDWHGSTTLAFALADGYSKTDEFSVSATGATLTDNGNGTYTISDAEANVIVTVRGVADTTTPEAEMSISTNKWTDFLNNITFGLFFKETETVTITATDKGSGVDEIYYLISKTVLDEDSVEALVNDFWTKYDAANKPSISPDRECIVYVKVIDKAQNVKYISSDGLVFDGTAPVISGIESGKTYYGQVVFGVTDGLAGMLKVEIDGVDKTHFEGQYVINPDNKEHTIVVTDNAGNKTTYSITVNKVYIITFKHPTFDMEARVNYGASFNEAHPDTVQDMVAEKDYHTFVGWYESTDGGETLKDTPYDFDTEVTDDVTLYPLFEIYTYTVTYKADGEVVGTVEVEHGADATAPAIPEKEGYTQTAPTWDKDGKNITADTEISAVYTVNEYTVTFMDENGVYKTVTVKHGEKVTMPETPTKDGYTVKWEKVLDTVTEDTTVKAVYTEIPATDKPSSPQTGDNTNLWLWVALLFVSGGAVLTLTVYDRKKRAAQK